MGFLQESLVFSWLSWNEWFYWKFYIIDLMFEFERKRGSFQPPSRICNGKSSWDALLFSKPLSPLAKCEEPLSCLFFSLTLSPSPTWKLNARSSWSTCAVVASEIRDTCVPGMKRKWCIINASCFYPHDAMLAQVINASCINGIRFPFSSAYS